MLKTQFKILYTFYFLSIAAVLWCSFAHAGEFITQIPAFDVPYLIGVPRDSLVAVSHQNGYRLFPVQIISYAKNNSFLWPESETAQKWKEAPLEFRDQIAISDAAFAPKALKHDLKLSDCHPAQGVPVPHPNDASKMIYLASCKQKITQPLLEGQRLVGYDLVAHYLESKFYRYQFKADNHMLFESIALKRAGTSTTLAQNAEITIHSDIKNFFTYNFDSTDIKSQMKHHSGGPLAALATVGFYLKILFFKLSLDLDTDVFFYDHGAKIPMTLTIPKGATKKLNPGSGLIYHFELMRQNGWTLEASGMPFYNGEETQNGTQWCRNGICRYEMIYHTSTPTERGLRLNFEIPELLVQAGFYPQFIERPKDRLKSKGWSIIGPNQDARVGFYFDVSQLTEGEHGWKFDMTFW
jgi:hypothetical protein